MKENEIYEEIRGLCIEMCRHDNRLKIVKNEDDNSTKFISDAAEFLKFDEKRISRDFLLYNFMATTSSPEYAIADFAYVLKTIQIQAPKAFNAITHIIRRWGKDYISLDKQEAWNDLWK